MLYTPEQAEQIKEAVRVLKEHDNDFIKHAKLKRALVKEVLKIAYKKTRSPYLKKLDKEIHASKYISKNWKKRETNLADKNKHFVKFTKAVKEANEQKVKDSLYAEEKAHKQNLKVLEGAIKKASTRFGKELTKLLSTSKKKFTPKIISSASEHVPAISIPFDSAKVTLYPRFWGDVAINKYDKYVDLIKKFRAKYPPVKNIKVVPLKSKLKKSITKRRQKELSALLGQAKIK